MSLVTATIQIEAPPARVWETVIDPNCLKQWVTIHRRLLYADRGEPRIGYRMEQEIHLRGVSLEVKWKLTECRPNKLAVWEGRGPARSHAHTEYRLTPHEGGTRFDYRNEFRAPLGPVGAIVSRALVGGIPLREAHRSLDRLRDCIQEGLIKGTGVG
jgi:uncharacterized protein YndB with AHSA1/START domain